MVRITRELQQHYRINNKLHRAIVGEFVASFFQVYIGLCINAQQLLSGSDDVTYSAVGWGLALFFAVLISNNITGSDVNPAVSFCSWTLGNISFLYFVCYAIAQIIACFTAALFCYVLYFGKHLLFRIDLIPGLEKINEYDGGIRQVFGERATAQIFTTYPAANLSVFTMVFNQVSFNG
jgi:glycerol uptake facilitator-like aquaporin